MAVNLKKVLAQKTYENLKEYVENGKDAISMLGYNNAEKFSSADIVTKFQTLADPDFIQETRNSWGDTSGAVPFKVMENVPFFIENTFNSFALKSRFFNVGKLRFPLIGSYKNINKSYFADEENCENFEAIKNIFASKFNVKIIDQNKTRNMIEYRGGKVRYCGEIVSSAIKSSSKFKNKFIKPYKINSESEFGLKLTPTRVGIGKAKLLLASHFKGQKVSQAEKIVALVNHWSGRAVLQINKKYSKQIKSKITAEPKQVAFISQLLADIFVCQALDMGVSNNKKIDNALKLQLSNAIASINLLPSDLDLASAMAEKATSAILQKIEIPFSNIQKNREAMGVSYISQPKDLYETLFGETAKSDFEKVGNDIVYKGNNKFFGSFETAQEQTLNLTPNNEKENQSYENNDLFEENLTEPSQSKQTKPDIADEKPNILVNNNESISDDDLFETEPVNIPSEPKQANNVVEENIIAPEMESESTSKVETENQTNPQNYLDLTEDILKAETPRSFENYLNLTEQIDKAERGRSFDDYLNLDEAIKKEEQGKSFDDYLIIKDNEKTSIKTQKQELSQENSQEILKRKISHIIHRDQKTLADFVSKETSENKINIILPTAEKSMPNIIYLQPLSLGKINQPLPKKAVIKSSEITYKQAEKAIDEIVNSIVGNILKSNKTTANAVKFEEKIESQMLKLSVKQMQELIVEIENFKVQTLNSIFEGKSAIAKDECGVKSASALINKEPKERHTLLKTDIKKVVLEYLKEVKIQDIRKDNSQSIIKNQTNIKPNPKKPFTMEDNLECYVETRDFSKEKQETIRKIETKTTKIATKKPLNTSPIKKETKRKPIKVVRQIRCTRCPLGVKINVKNAKAKSSSKNLE